MTFPFLQQYDAMDCGPTCIAMISRFYGKNISIQTMREKAQLGKNGVNLLGISEAAEFIGFRTFAVKVSYYKLIKDVKLPCILHWNQSHFVVLYKIKKNTLFVADPGKGLVAYTREEFQHHWISDTLENESCGVALLLDPTPRFKSDNADELGSKKILALSNIIEYVLPYKKLVLQVFLGILLASLLQLILPYLAQSIVDVGINTNNIHFIYIILIAQLSLITGRLVIEFIRSWILLHISTRINISILTDFLIKLMKLPLSFFDSKQTGDILQRINDHLRIEQFLTGSSLNILFSLLNLVIFSIVLGIYNLKIFFVFSSASILYTIWVILFLRKRRILDYKRFEISSKEQSATIQMVQAMQEIKLHNCERPMRWKWEHLQARIFKYSTKVLILNQWQQTGAFFINEGKNIFITFLSAKAVIEGQMTLGAMLAVQYIIGQLNSPIEQMISFLQSWQNAKISIDRLNEIHKMEDEEPEEKNLLQQLPTQMLMVLQGGLSSHAWQIQAAPVNSFGIAPEFTSYNEQRENIDAAITFRNVSFTYPGAGNEAVLTDINMCIPLRKTTAIVGTSGSGKTTLLKLLLKYYEPQKGDILLGKTSLGNISHKTWRNHCGIVMQESFIFSDTILKNIALMEERVNMERLDYAASVANVREFVETLPLGFNTRIGQEGSGISMGQKQRILIARAVYKNPDFILLDEATNSLDANNESTIMQNLQSFISGKTVVVVAHRLSTVKNADKIIVLKKGVIAEIGNHQELIQLKGEYYGLVKNQLDLGT